MTGSDSLTTALELAHFVSGTESRDIPASALDAAARCILDLLGAAAAGFDTTASLAMRNFSLSFFPPGPATLWFSDQKLSPAGAALANSAAASALDLDDGNRDAGGHPGAAVIPGGLAQAEALGKSGLDFLAAMALGYEVAVRVSAARDLSSLDTFSTGRWCGYGAVAAAGWLYGVSAREMAQAMAISGLHAPLMSAAAYSRQGSAVKEGIPWATMTGLAALDLSRQGFSGPLDILDHPDYFDREKILSGLGDTWAVERTYFKPYSCCRWSHAALDGLAALTSEHQLAAGDIESMTVQTFGRALRLKNETDPESLEGVQFSVPYCLALAAIRGPEALQPLTRDVLGLPDVAALAGRVRLELDREIEDAFPARAGARLILDTGRGRFSRQVEYPYGDPANPMSQHDLETKFLSLCGNRFSIPRAEAVLDAVSRLRTGELSPLLNALGPCPEEL